MIHLACVLYSILYSLIAGYLPVAALLLLMMVLPFVFQVMRTLTCSYDE